MSNSANEESLSVITNSKLNRPKSGGQTTASLGRVSLVGMCEISSARASTNARYRIMLLPATGKYNVSMQRFKEIGSAWGLALLMMITIFMFSAQPVAYLPNFGFFDGVIKKGGHMLGYAVLAVCYWRGLKWERERAWQAWLLAVLYAITDEFHQEFVPGRHPSALDVFLFDGTGGAIGLWLRQRLVSC
jgi:hypothetical protein